MPTEPHIDPIVAELLASLERLGTSQIAIAERAGISAPYLNQIAAGKRQPTLAVVHRLADVAGRRLAMEYGYCQIARETNQPNQP